MRSGEDLGRARIVERIRALVGDHLQPLERAAPVHAAPQDDVVLRVVGERRAPLREREQRPAPGREQRGDAVRGVPLAADEYIDEVQVHGRAERKHHPVEVHRHRTAAGARAEVHPAGRCVLVRARAPHHTERLPIEGQRRVGRREVRGLLERDGVVAAIRSTGDAEVHPGPAIANDHVGAIDAHPNQIAVIAAAAPARELEERVDPAAGEHPQPRFEAPTALRRGDGVGRPEQRGVVRA